MQIGVPKETITGENRVACTPDVAKKLVAKGFSIAIEANAGQAAGYTDAAYEAVGVSIVDRTAANGAAIVLRVRKPALEDIAQMSEKAISIGFIETCEDDDIVAALLKKQINAIALERIPRISRAQSMDALSSQSNISGYRSAIEAASQYGHFFPLMMTSSGSAKPARVIILGVGVAGLQAIATTRRLGADVHAYDLRPETREQIESLGAKPIVLDLDESGSGEGGYAKELSDEAKQQQQSLLADELAKAHVIITTALIPCRPAPILIPEAVVERMREGSVIIDLAAANGGNCPLTEADKIVVKHGVTIVGHTNYPSMMAGDASAFYAQGIANLLAIMVDDEDGKPVLKDLDEDEITKAALIRPATEE